MDEESQPEKEEEALLLGDEGARAAGRTGRGGSSNTAGESDPGPSPPYVENTWSEENVSGTVTDAHGVDAISVGATVHSHTDSDNRSQRSSQSITVPADCPVTGNEHDC